MTKHTNEPGRDAFGRPNLLPMYNLEVNGEYKGTITGEEIAYQAMRLTMDIIANAKNADSLTRVLKQAAASHGSAYALVASAALQSLCANLLIPLMETHPDADGMRNAFKEAIGDE